MPENIDKKKIFWFAYFDASEPSVRYRAVYPLQELERKLNIDYTLGEKSRFSRHV